jgi:predicted TPR repeat methyltransferase
MKCCNTRQCEALEDVFDADYAEDDLKAYRKKGPAKTTRTLLDGIRALGDVRGRSLIDIGGGIGAIQLELLKDGLATSTGVDASAAFLSAAKSEAEKLGFGERASYQHGNFVERAPDLAPADFVTLDRVICCYPDMHSLVRLSAERARRAYAIVSPRDTWWMRAAERGLNLWELVQRSAFRFYVHSDQHVEGILSELGFTRALYRTHGPWQVKVWKREDELPTS